MRVLEVVLVEALLVVVLVLAEVLVVSMHPYKGE